MIKKLKKVRRPSLRDRF